MVRRNVILLLVAAAFAMSAAPALASAAGGSTTAFDFAKNFADEAVAIIGVVVLVYFVFNLAAAGMGRDITAFAKAGVSGCVLAIIGFGVLPWAQSLGASGAVVEIPRVMATVLA